MKFNEILDRIRNKKFLLLLLLLGVAIMFFSGKTQNDNNENIIYNESVDKIDVERLEKILKKIKEVKSCDVYVTYDNHGESKFAYDTSSGNSRQLEIKLSNDEPLIESVSNPKIRGIFVLLKGEKINEREVVQIIKAATGTPMHRIFIKISEEE